VAITVSGERTIDARAVAHVDLDAIERNCASLRDRLGRAQLCAVVKADGYGHGAAECAGAALAGGATWLAVATAAEAADLRRAGIEARLLVMGALDPTALSGALDADADLVVWNDSQLDAIAAAARGRRPRLHVKHDSGMVRLGTADPDLAVELADRVAAHDRCELAGLMTHFATADQPDSDFLDRQLERFMSVVERVKPKHPDCIVHAANSAAVLRDSETHFEMARCGIAIYGLDPFNADPAEHGLRPALELTSYVADVKQIEPGDSVGYGRSWIAQQTTQIGVLPIGYGDGYRRGLSNRGEALIGGRRFPIVGTVSMDNVTVDLGTDSGVAAGEPAILIGRAGEQRLLAEQLAAELDTINYEITCGLSPRVPRVHRRGGGAGAR
jgi:alanine racemase